MTLSREVGELSAHFGHVPATLAGLAVRVTTLEAAESERVGGRSVVGRIATVSAVVGSLTGTVFATVWAIIT